MFTIPTTIELKEAILNSLSAGFDAGIDDEGKAALSVIADTQAAQVKQLYLAAAQIQKNIFVDTCDEETLFRFGKIRLGRLPFSAVAGKYICNVTGTIGASIPANTTFKSDDDSKNPGVIFILDSAYNLVSSPDTITLRCLTLGEEGKLEVGDTLTSTTPIPNVDSSAEVDTESVQPLAGETISEYREKVLASFRLEAQGGSVADYRIWAADAQGVQKVYPYPKSGTTSEIDLYVEATIADSTDGKGTPSGTTLTDVESVVEQNPDTTLDVNERGRRPMNAIVNFLPVVPKTVDVTITGFQDLDTQTQNDIIAAFDSAISKIRPFIPGTDSISEKNDVIDVNKAIAIIISAKPGAIFTSVSFTVDSVSVSTYTFDNGEISYFNPSITFN